MLKKYRCSCGETWFAEEKENCFFYGVTKESHLVKVDKNINSKDYAELWGMDLENANRHSLTDMPEEVLKILNNILKDENIVSKIMKKFYEKELGI